MTVMIGCLLGGAIVSSDRMKLFQGQSGFYYEKPNAKELAVTRAQIKDYWEKAAKEERTEIQDIGLFRREEGKIITNPELNREAKGTVFETAGNMNLLVPGRLMMGSFVNDSDKNGCVISKKMAEELFSTYHVLGQVIYLEKTAYKIRGILDLTIPLCMIQGAEGSSYPYIRVDAPGVSLDAVRQKLAGILPEAEAIVSEGDFYYGVGTLFLWFPAWVLWIFLIKQGKKGIRWFERTHEKGKKTRIVVEMMRIALLAVGFGAGCCLLAASLHFTDDYVPTAWSDFGFWSELAEEKWRNFQILWENQLLICDLDMLTAFLGVSAASLLCGIFLSCMLRQNKNKE